MHNSNKHSILIVEDELIVALDLSKALESLDFCIAGIASTEDEAVLMARSHHPSIILMDINLGSGGSGLNAALRINKVQSIPIIYVTAYSSDKMLELAGKTNPYGYVLKPYNFREIKAAINTALIRFNYETEINKSQQRLKAVVEAAELEIIEYDHDTKTITLPQYTKRFKQLGFTREMSLDTFLQFFVERDAHEINRRIANKQPFNFCAKLNVKDIYGLQYMEIYLSQIHYLNSRVQVGAVQDVTDNQKNIANLKISDLVLTQMQESVVILDMDEKILHVNPAFCRLTDYKQNEIESKLFKDYLLQDRKEDLNLIKRSSKVSSTDKSNEVTIKCRHGKLVHAMMTVTELIDDNLVDKLIVTLTDVTRLVETERNLNKLVFTDPLTGFGNRAYLNHTLHMLHHNPTLHQIALIFVDIDNFKMLNDRYGHDFGDKILIEFSNRLSIMFREPDHLIRIGGDEFIIVLTGQFTKRELRLICEKILTQLKTDFHIDNITLPVSCSIGITYCEHKLFNADNLMKQADSAMYHAKRLGKQKYCFYDQKLAAETEYRVFIEQGLRTAIAEEKISIFLQPIVDSKGKTLSVEALCRWYDKDIGFVPLNIFIPVAEETNLIQALGFCVIKEAFLAKQQLIDAGFPDIIININFSQKQLQDKSTFKAICSLLDRYKLDAGGFVVEVTESILHHSSSEDTLQRLKQKGFNIALDDFGTGYSSLSRLHDYTVDIIKIDKSFIDSICTNAKQNIITKSIVNLGQNLGYKVVAEGIEEESQYQVLHEMGCENMQGYYFAKPLPIHELIRHLA